MTSSVRTRKYISISIKIHTPFKCTERQVADQVDEVGKLQADLEDQHAAVTAISNFILVESEEASNIEDELTGETLASFIHSEASLLVSRSVGLSVSLPCNCLVI